MSKRDVIHFAVMSFERANVFSRDRIPQSNGSETACGRDEFAVRTVGNTPNSRLVSHQRQHFFARSQDPDSCCSVGASAQQLVTAGTKSHIRDCGEVARKRK